MIHNLKAILKVGSQIKPFECLIAYALPFLFFASDAIALKELFFRNFACQLISFLFIVQIPLAVTGKMAYVDLGWPFGLVLLGVNGLIYGSGWYLRRYIICGCMILHGGRMFAGNANKSTVYIISCVMILRSMCCRGPFLVLSIHVQ
jgi:hypothetical protein